MSHHSDIIFSTAYHKPFLFSSYQMLSYLLIYNILCDSSMKRLILSQEWGLCLFRLTYLLGIWGHLAIFACF